MSSPCRICGAEADVFHVFPRRALFNKPLEKPEPYATADLALAYCRACRHISGYYASALGQQVLDRIYRELYVHHPPTGLSAFQKQWTEFVADWLARRLEPGANVLEVGCHDGFFLSMLRDRGARVVGVEPSPFAAAARERGIEVHERYFDPADFDPRAFDVVVARHVVEHVLEPVPLLDGMRSLLAPGGLLYVEVPNSLASLEERFYPEFHIDHVSYFTPAQLAAILSRSGFAILHLESARAYMRFPFLMSLSRLGRGGRTDGGWFQDFGIASALAQVGPDFDAYRTRLSDLARRGRVGVWGTGSIGTQFAIDGGWTEDVAWYVDPNPSVRGLKLSVTGHRVHGPETLAQAGIETVLIASGWERDAKRQLAEAAPTLRVSMTFSDLLPR